MSSLLVRKRHLYGEEPPCDRTRYCSTGCRLFFARHGLSWSNFLRDGLDADVFIQIGDAMGLKAVQHAREEAERGR